MNITRGSQEGAEAEHRERLAAAAAELEATRRLLEQMSESPPIEPVGRRVVQWMMPVAATALVAFVAIMAIGGEDATADRELTSQTVEIEAAPVIEALPEPVAEPKPVVVAETPEPVVAPKPVKPKKPKDPKKPLILDPNGDPLG